MPRITIIMPSLNQARYLEEAIRSILDQNYPGLEFMILDGGSTDGSREIIEKYAASLTYWQSQPDGGQSDAIIQGFCRASGDLWGWVNSDDVLLPGALGAIARAFWERPRGGLFGGNYLLMDKNGRIIRARRHPANAGWFARHGLFLFNPPGSFYRPADYRAVGGLRVDLHYAMDTDLYIRMAAAGTQYVHVDRYLSAFRHHETQKTSKYLNDTMSETVQIHGEWPSPLRHFARQRRWYYLYRLWQVANCNYFRVLLDTVKLRGQPWKAIK